MNILINNKPFLGIILLFLVVSLLNIPVLTTLWRHSFDDGTYSHAYLIPFITLYLYFKLSDVNKLIYRNHLSWAPLLLLIISGCLLFITANAQISVGYWMSFLAVLITGVVSVYRFNWYVVFPASFLIFIFPFWGLLTNILQNISVSAVTYLMSFTGIPTYVEAEFITIPAGVFEIADGCSGLRYIIVSLAISSLFIFLYIDNIKKASLFISIAVLGALITNWIRITALILIGEYTDMQSSLMEDHNTFGWYLYIPFMFLLFYWGNKLSTGDLLEITTKKLISTQPNKKIWLYVISIITISSTSPKLFFHNNLTNDLFLTDTNFQPQVFNYSSKVINHSFLNHEATYFTYHFDGIDLDGKPTYFGNNFIPPSFESQERLLLKNWNMNVVSKGRENALILYQYKINKIELSSERQFKLARLKQGVLGRNETELHWVFMTCESNCNAEKKRLIETIN